MTFDPDELLTATFAEPVQAPVFDEDMGFPDQETVQTCFTLARAGLSLQEHRAFHALVQEPN